MIFKKLLAGTTAFISGMLIFTSVAFAEVYTVLKDSVNVRKAASSNSQVLGQVNSNEKVEVVGSVNDWKKIKYGSSYGWVMSQFLKGQGSSSRGNTSNSNRTASNVSSSKGNAKILSNDVNLRSGAGTDFRIKGKLSNGQQVTVLGTSGNWANVRTSNGTEGWVMKSFVSGISNSNKNSSSNNSKSSNSNKRNSTASSRGDNQSSDVRENIVAYARRFLGVGYVYGGSKPSGFDCSGFTKYVLSNYGIYIDRVAADQARNGSWIAKSDLRKGDLVFFDTDGGRNYINHVGIYTGNGNFVHASSGKGRVLTSNLNEGFYAGSYMTARRVVN